MDTISIFYYVTHSSDYDADYCKYSCSVFYDDFEHCETREDMSAELNELLKIDWPDCFQIVVENEEEVLDKIADKLES